MVGDVTGEDHSGMVSAIPEWDNKNHLIPLCEALAQKNSKTTRE
jgi:hypothetical protein